MRLVPRQLRRYGMTGNVPYYGGRLTPAQTYAITHPPQPPPAPTPADDALRALQHLFDMGILTAEEYETYRARVTS